jgi:hypothetical protein
MKRVFELGNEDEKNEIKRYYSEAAVIMSNHKLPF